MESDVGYKLDHESPNVTIKRINGKYKWKHMTTDVMEYCLNCTGCAVNSSNSAKWRPQVE